MKSFVFSVVVFLVFFLLSSQVSADLISDTCKKTPSFNLCESTLRADPQSSKADVQGLALVAVKKLVVEGTKTENEIKQLIGKTKDQPLLDALKICADKYNIIVHYDFPVAVEAITKGNPKFAEGAAVDAARSSDKCASGIASTPHLASSNKLVHDLDDIVLYIVRLLL
ncbi:hypothetical protein Ddye_019351 [Dipteronia dyeriana]|uniref:Pectinesterase inhibitor domain-containing protein n=1 Tax=Dipteronia dyeriana TaxID=168575 RepID=A0AAD9TXT9_9ROSI|nr:hypothetical protein Ddye_019351 [Dipteronia dyeriana]